MTVTGHTYTAEVADQSLVVTNGTVRLDEAYSPYGRATMTLGLPADPATAQAVLAALDPRAGGRLRLRLVAAYGQAWTVADLTAAGGGAAAGVTALLDGGPVAMLTGHFGRPLNPFGLRSSRTADLDLTVHRRAASWSAGTVTVEAATGELLLWTDARLDTTAAVPASPTLRSAVSLVLGTIGAALEPGPADAPLDLTAAAWEPGVTGWDYLSPLVGAAGLRLWCDVEGRWWLTPPAAGERGGMMFTPQQVTDLDDDLDVAEYADAVIVTYRWRDSSGVEHVVYDTATAPGVTTPRYVYAVELERPFVGYGYARALVLRMRERGSAQRLSAVADPSARPGMALVTTDPAGQTRAGAIGAVVFDLAGDRMTITTRELLDVAPSAWLALPSGESWDDSPAGATWTDETIGG